MSELAKAVELALACGIVIGFLARGSWSLR